MFIDLNNKLCHIKEVNLFDWEILDNYVALILDAKYNQVDTNKVASNWKQLSINYLMVLLVSLFIKKYTLTYCVVQKW